MNNEASGYKPGNYRIISLRTARRILHVEDCLQLGKIRFDLWDYTRGQGAAAHVDAYLDVDTARVLAAELASEGLTTTDGLEELGGGSVKGQIVARALKVEMADTRNPIRISIRNGPGVRQPSGLISPAGGARMTSIQILLSWLDAKRVGLALLHHLQAWATVTYSQRLEAGTWQSRDEGSSEPLGPLAAEAITGDLYGAQDRSLRYADGTPVGDSAAEQEAFRAYIQALESVPRSVDVLREWIVDKSDEP